MTQTNKQLLIGAALVGLGYVVWKASQEKAAGKRSSATGAGTGVGAKTPGKSEADAAAGLGDVGVNEVLSTGFWNPFDSSFVGGAFQGS